MKSFALVSLIVVTMLTVKAQLQYPLNGGFEEWTSGSIAGSTYDSIVAWDTPQLILAVFNVPDTVTYRTTTANSGTSACLLVTKEISIFGFFTLIAPGTITTGRVLIDLADTRFIARGGAPIDCKPTFLTGFYRYAPSGPDKARIVVSMTSASGDTVSQAFLEIPTATTGGYQPFDVPLTYTGIDDPVLAHVSISSGNRVGSTMYVDDVAFKGGNCDIGPATCSPTTPPTGQNHTFLSNSVVLNWDALTDASACQVRGKQVPGGIESSIFTFSPPFNRKSIPLAQLGAGSTWTWRVRCACGFSPLVLTPYTAYSDTVSIPVTRENQDLKEASKSGSLSFFPNPASSHISVEGGAGLINLEIIDATGRLRQVVPIQEWSGSQQTIQLDNLEPGFFMLIGRYNYNGAERTESLPFSIQ